MSNAFGRRLRLLRKARGLTLRDLAERVGIDFTYVSKIETGELAAPSEEVIRKMAAVLEMPFPDDLLLLNGKPPQEWGDVLEDNARCVEILRHLAARRYETDVYDAILGVLDRERYATVALATVVATEQEAR